MARTRSPGGEMHFLDHLEELRGRLFWCAGAILLGMIIAFTLLTKVQIITLVAEPIAPYLEGEKLMYTNPGAQLTILMQASFVIGLLLAAPVVIYQLWGFISPAMYRHEKRIVVPVIVAAIVLFATGLTVAFKYILPITLKFLFTDINLGGLKPMIAANEYFSFAFMLCAAFALVFELPVVISLLSLFGVVTAERLGSWRRFAAVAAVVVGAFIAPDPSSMLMLAVPFYLLYEISIGVAFFIQRAKKRKKDREVSAEAAETGADTIVDDAPRGLGVPE
jgi:sec-independent protein translocase protein TatC